MRFNGGLKQFGQVFPKKEADDFPEYWNLQEYNQNINEEMMLKGFSSFRASRSASAYASQYHMKNINEVSNHNQVDSKPFLLFPKEYRECLYKFCLYLIY